MFGINKLNPISQHMVAAPNVLTKPVKWTKEEEAVLWQGSDAPRCVAMIMEKLPGRTRRAIEKRCEILGIRLGLPGTGVAKWTALQVNLTAEEYEGLGKICKHVQMKKATFIRWMIQQLMIEETLNGEGERDGTGDELV